MFEPLAHAPNQADRERVITIATLTVEPENGKDGFTGAVEALGGRSRAGTSGAPPQAGAPA